ncbi:MAG: pentapeptide repeat-containing protein [Chloroflexota bacterium]
MDEKVGWEQTKAIWADKDTRLIYKVMGGILLLAIGVFAGRLIYAAPDAQQAWGYGVNLFTGVISTLATVLILDQLAERRADRKAEQALKRQLVDDAASTSNEIAKNAVHQLRRKGWLKGENGLLKGADLSDANLQGADLVGANLQEADLRLANLHGAQMRGVNLKGALLWLANLQGAELSRTNLQGAEFGDANLEGATLDDAKFDEFTRLPNYNLWIVQRDTRKFTDPTHPDFWRSREPHSPAYRGKSEE